MGGNRNAVDGQRLRGLYDPHDEISTCNSTSRSGKRYPIVSSVSLSQSKRARQVEAIQDVAIIRCISKRVQDSKPGFVSLPLSQGNICRI